MWTEAESTLRKRAYTFRLCVAVCLLFGLALPAAAQAGKRLILKDGTWQEIIKYERDGDRTRYLSTPRRQWEDLPTDLVDWEATATWNAHPLQLPPDEDEGPDADAQASDRLLVAPGLRLPAVGGVFILDQFSGEASLNELIQTPGLRAHNSDGLFHSGISAGVTFRQRFELRGLHARTQAHILLPKIFIKIDRSPQGKHVASADRFRIVRMEPASEVRVLADVKVSVMGKQEETQRFVPARVSSFHDGWLEIAPSQDLVPGEYALVEMLDHGRVNSYVWDFGVNPGAPGNINARRGYSPPADERSTYSPALKQREQ